MENKLQELTKKIYSEGIEKAKTDAEIIVVEAREKADEIIKNAQKEASDIIAKAHDSVAELKRNAESEIKMASRQSLAKLKQQIIDLILVKSIDKPVKDVMNDKEFVGSLIQKVAGCFNNNIHLVLPETDKDKMAAYFKEKAVAELLSGIDITFDGNMKAGFKVSPKNENYIISFTDDDFVNFFKAYMRPKTIQLLFGE